MTEHDMLLMVQKQVSGLQSQVAGLVIERDALRETANRQSACIGDWQAVGNAVMRHLTGRSELVLDCTLGKLEPVYIVLRSAGIIEEGQP